MKRALVFGGGGAKGAYELGVWKAIREMNLQVDIVTGSSVGALNGAMFVTGEYDLAEKLWLQLRPNQVIKTKETDPKVVYAKFVKEMATGGADTSPLEELLHAAIDEKKARESKIIFGLSTCSFPSLKPLQITLDQIPEGKLCDYLIASAAAYPTFKPKDIDGNKYIDGGYHDNLPINFAINLGADDVIAVNLQAIGVYRRVKDKSIHIHTIIPTRDLGSFLMFDKDLIKRNSIVGYQDTLKYFGACEGLYYTFEKGEITKAGDDFGFELRQLITRIFHRKYNRYISFAQLYSSRRMFKDVATNHEVVYSQDQINLIRGLDLAGHIFGFDDLKIYKLHDFCEQLLTAVTDTLAANPEFSRDYFKLDAANKISPNEASSLSGKLLVCYLLKKLVEFLNSPSPLYEIYTLFMLYPNDSLAALTLLTLVQIKGVALPNAEALTDTH